MNPAGPPVVAARLREEGLVAGELAGSGYGLYLQDVLVRKPISGLRRVSVSLKRVFTNRV